MYFVDLKVSMEAHKAIAEVIHTTEPRESQHGNTPKKVENITIETQETVDWERQRNTVKCKV